MKLFIDKLVNILKKTNLAILLLLFLVSIFSVYYIFILKTPYRIYNSDVFHQLALVQKFDQSSYKDIGDPFFKDGTVDFHAGPYNYALFLLKIVTNSSYYDVILIATFFNILLICCSLYFFAKNQDLSKIKIFLFMVISLIGWGSLNLFFAGIYEYTNLLITGAFPPSMGIGIIIISLGIIKLYFERENKSLLFLFYLLLSVLLISHVLSGILLVFFSFLFVVEEFFKKLKITRYMTLMIIIIIGSIITSLFIWPLFNLITVISSTQTVQVGTTDRVTENYFSFSYWPQLLGFTFLGVIFVPHLVRKRIYFLLLLTISSIIITLSYLFPIRISLYWRFFPFIFLGLSLILSNYIHKFSIKKIILFLSIFLILGIHNTKNKIDYILANEEYGPLEFKEVIKNIKKDAVVLSDPNTAYHIAGLFNQPVMAVSYNHANPASILESKNRYEQNIEFLSTDLSYDDQRAILKKYEVEYILIDNMYRPDYIGLNYDRSWLTHFELVVPNTVIFEDDRFILYKIINDEK